jgi:hypothetical protein
MPLRFAVEGSGHAEAVEEAVEQAKMAFGGFREEELRGEGLAGGIVLHTESGEPWAAAFQPVVRATIELHEFAFASDAQTTPAMSRSTAFAGRTEILLTKQTAEGFAAEVQAFAFVELLAEMVIVEAGAGRTGQTQNGLTSALRQSAMAGTAAVGVSQRRYGAKTFRPLNLDTVLFLEDNGHLAAERRQAQSGEARGCGKRRPIRRNPLLETIDKRWRNMT